MQVSFRWYRATVGNRLGPNVKVWLGIGTTWYNLVGSRDQKAKNWLGLGTIGSPIQSLYNQKMRNIYCIWRICYDTLKNNLSLTSSNITELRNWLYENQYLLVGSKYSGEIRYSRFHLTDNFYLEYIERYDSAEIVFLVVFLARCTEPPLPWLAVVREHAY